jgi:DNA-binding NarL/FixJ family response regulator
MIRTGRSPRTDLSAPFEPSPSSTARRIGVAFPGTTGRAAPQLRPGAVLPTCAPLSAREQEVLVLLAAGLTDRAIATVLQISPRTVTTHVGSIYNKLGTSSRVVAATFAVRYGLAECAI